MKQFLLAVMLVVYSFVLHAQTVIVKDSLLDIYMQQGLGPAIVTAYTYDSSCHLAVKTSYNQRDYFSYYPDGNLYQDSAQHYQYNGLTDSGFWYNTSLYTYTYNSAGKTTSLLVTYGRQLIDSYKDSNVYDINEYLVRSYDSSWNDTANKWVANSETDDFNNAAGRVDSSITTNYPQAIITTSYFSYDSSSGKIHQRTDYFNYTSNFRQQTYFYDSTNGMEKDSIVTKGGATDSTLSVASIFKHNSFYDANNYKTEEEFYDQQTGIFEIGDTKIYYTYGPCASAYPVTLLSFSGERQNNNALLNWQTANETNTSLFNIERSTDGEHFTILNKIVAAGNSNNSKSYEYTDEGVTSLGISKLYYRLQEVDKGGTINYSSIQTIDFSKAHSLFYISPNPSKNFINIVSSANVIDAQVNITDMSGKKLFTTKQNFNAGQQLKVSLAQFPSEVLIVTVKSNNNNQEQFKVVKE